MNRGVAPKVYNALIKNRSSTLATSSGYFESYAHGSILPTSSISMPGESAWIRTTWRNTYRSISDSNRIHSILPSPPETKWNIERGSICRRIWVSILAQFPSLAQLSLSHTIPILSGFHERLAANFTGELTCYPRATHLIFKRGFKRDSRFETEYLNN